MDRNHGNIDTRRGLHCDQAISQLTQSAAPSLTWRMGRPSAAAATPSKRTTAAAMAAIVTYGAVGTGQLLYSALTTVRISPSAAVMIQTGGACAAIYVTYRRRRTTLRRFSSAEKFRRFNSCYLLGPICSGPESSCWKSGRLRIGSQTGSIFKAAMDAAPPAGIESKRRSLLMASSGAPARASICASPIWKFGPARASFRWRLYPPLV